MEFNALNKIICDLIFSHGYNQSTMLKPLAYCALQSASLLARFALSHQQTMGYFKTPYLFVKSSSPLSRYFMEKMQEDGPRRIEKIAQELADDLADEQANQLADLAKKLAEEHAKQSADLAKQSAEEQAKQLADLAKKGKKEKDPNYALLLDMFYKKLDALTELEVTGELDADLQLKRQDFKEHLKVFFLLQIQHNFKDVRYKALKKFRHHLRKRQEEIAKKIIKLIANEKPFEEEKYRSISQMLLEKLSSDEFKDYPKELVDEFRRLFDFDMPFVIDNQVQQNRFAEGSIKDFNTFCPTLTVTSQIFNLNRKTCFVIGSKFIGKSYAEFLLYYLKKYTQQRVFYIGQSLNCGSNSLLAKQLFQACWEKLSPDEIDALSEIFYQEQDSQNTKGDNSSDEKFEILLKILKRNFPSTILIDQCNYLTSQFGQDKRQQIARARFERLVNVRSSCIFSSSINTENKKFQDIAMHLRRNPPQQIFELWLYNNITNPSDLWAGLDFELGKDMKNSNTSLRRQQISNRSEVILHDEDIKIAIENLFSEIKGFNFLDLKYLAKWLLQNNKQTLQNFDSTRFQLQMKNDFVKDCLQRLLTLTVDWVRRAKQQGKKQERIDFVNNALTTKRIELNDNPNPFQDFPNHLLESKITGNNGNIVKILQSMDQSIQFQKQFLSMVKPSLIYLIRTLIVLFNRNSYSFTIGGLVQFMIGQACAVGNMEIKNEIMSKFGLEGHMNISRALQKPEKEILQNLMQQSLQSGNKNNILFSNTKANQKGCDYFFMVNKTNGPLVIIFMECGLSKDKDSIKKLLAQIDIQFYPIIKKNLLKYKDIKVEFKVWITTRHPQLLNKATKDEFLELKAFEEEKDYIKREKLVSEIPMELNKSIVDGKMKKILCSDIVEQHQIEVKITDLATIFKMISVDLYNAAIKH